MRVPIAKVILVTLGGTSERSVTWAKAMGAWCTNGEFMTCSNTPFWDIYIISKNVVISLTLLHGYNGFCEGKNGQLTFF